MTERIGGKKIKERRKRKRKRKKIIEQIEETGKM
jgi:hypothetical protein